MATVQSELSLRTSDCVTGVVISKYSLSQAVSRMLLCGC